MSVVLPIDALLPEILSSLKTNLVIEAAPGAGKTTRVPPALLEFGPVVVLEPRRIAARMAARRVAEEMGALLGGRVGYQVRFEDVTCPATELRFVTEGVLTRKLLGDPLLAGVSVVVLDEFHERHLETDVALALLRRLQRTSRPDLRLVVMSATLDPAPLCAFLGDCPVLASEGRVFPLDIRYTPHSAQPLEQLVADAVERLVREGLDGDVLVFLPGAAEIRAAARACEGIARAAGLLVLPLHGDLSPAEQDQAVARADRRKVILSTNVAESSVTIDGVSAVIDSGLARIASDSPWTGMPRLEVKRISQASATQRAGRAGRTGPGRVVRLFPEDDFRRRPAHGDPDIQRRELSQVLLDLHALDAWPVDWFEAPLTISVDAAERLLHSLDAIDSRGRITGEGRRMAQLPVHPRIGRLMREAAERGAVNEAAHVAAQLSTGGRGGAERIEAQLRRMVRGRSSATPHGLELALMAGFPDRIAQRRSAGSADIVLAGGEPARLAHPESLGRAEFLVAVDIEERREHGTPLVRSAWRIEPDWLVELAPDRLEEVNEVVWNRAAERVDAVSALRFGALTLTESRGAMPDPERAARMLADQALAADLSRFVDCDALEAWKSRINFVAEQSGSLVLGEESVKVALSSLCNGLRSFRELEQVAREGGLIQALRSQLPSNVADQLDRLAPERITLASGRRTRVNYEPGKPPWIASRLQDFFGMKETPRVAGGSVPVLVHLLAPNQRPVQVTQDLAGFWERLYPQVRRELMRRYPRHAWPERPDTPVTSR